MKLTEKQKLALIFYLVEAMRDNFPDPLVPPPGDLAPRGRKVMDWVIKRLPELPPEQDIGFVAVPEEEVGDAIVTLMEEVINAEELPPRLEPAAGLH